MLLNYYFFFSIFVNMTFCIWPKICKPSDTMFGGFLTFYCTAFNTLQGYKYRELLLNQLPWNWISHHIMKWLAKSNYAQYVHPSNKHHGLEKHVAEMMSVLKRLVSSLCISIFQRSKASSLFAEVGGIANLFFMLKKKKTNFTKYLSLYLFSCVFRAKWMKQEKWYKLGKIIKTVNLIQK